MTVIERAAEVVRRTLATSSADSIPQALADAGLLRASTSADLSPGDIVRWNAPSGFWSSEAVIEKRKITDDGWWLVGGGGLADSAIDSPRSRWEIAR